jgi:hypothetical protein
MRKFLISLFTSKFKKECRELESERYIRITYIGEFYNSRFAEFYHQDRHLITICNNSVFA